MRKTKFARVQGQLARLGSITRVWIFALLGLVLVSLPAPQANATIASSVVMDEATGRIIHAYRADARHPPASLAKMMTLYLVFEALEQRRLSLNSRVAVSFRAASRVPSKIYLRPGQVVTVQQLILATAIKSANDAATALGERVAGSESAFAARMTAKARQLGMRSTVFRTASGLPAGDYTTARDMAILARALHLRFPQYSQVFSRRYFRWGARTYRNTNRLLHARGDVTGMKTGYTRAAGFNLVLTASSRGKKSIMVVLGGRTSSQRYAHASNLLGVAARGIPANIVVASRRAKIEKIEAKEDDDDTDDGKRTDDDEGEDEEPVKPAITVAKKSEGFSLIARAAAGTRVKVAEARAVKSMLRYGIEVGKFRDQRKAQTIAKKAYYKVPGAYRSGSTRVAVLKEGRGRKAQYLARVLGFNAASANRTCQHLKRQRVACRTVSYPVQSASARAKLRQHAAAVSTVADTDGDAGVGYGLQIGLYRSIAAAKAAAARAHAVLPAVERRQTKISVVRVASHGARFAARIEGYTAEARAGRACDRLDGRGLGCRTVSYVVKPVRRAAAKRPTRQHADAGASDHASDSDLGFGVQVGVFRSFGHARLAARKAHRSVVRSVRARTKVTVVRIEKGRRAYFAARIEGFRRETGAERICDRLDGKGFGCRTIAYSL